MIQTVAPGTLPAAARYTRAMPFRRFHASLIVASLLIPVALQAQSFKSSDLAPLTPKPDTSLAGRTQALNAIFSDYWQDKLRHAPEMASLLGDHRYDDQLTDYSAEAYNDALERGQKFIVQLGAIDTTGMPEQEILSKQLLVNDLIDQQESEVCEPWQTPVTQMAGPQVELPELVDSLRFATAQDYANYIARLNKVPTAFLQVSTGMSLGQQAGRTEPQFIMQKVLAQVKAMAALQPEATPFAAPLKKFPSSISPAQQTQIRAAMLTAIRTKVLPAYAHLAKFLESDYIPNARKDAGEWANTDGDACYAHLLRHFTTTDLTPGQVFQMGQRDVARIEPEMLAIVQQLGYKDLRSFHATLVADPKQHPQSAEQLLDLYRQYETQMEAKLPLLVTKIPKTKLEVVAMPAFGAADEAPAEYWHGAPDGSRPGEVHINTSNLDQRLLYQVPGIAFHEGFPGHHLQTAIAQELTDLPNFRRFGDYTAFSEGWAFYAEGMGAEVGFYKDPYSRFGMLENQMWRAVRLVVDTGVHSKHWTRDQAVAYFRDHTAMDDATIQEEVNRYISWPGQATAYDVGRLKILELRAKAQKELGARFDIRTFHDEVLGAGSLPLDVLEQRVDAWLTTQKSVAKQ